MRTIVNSLGEKVLVPGKMEFLGENSFFGYFACNSSEGLEIYLIRRDNVLLRMNLIKKDDLRYRII